MFGNDVQPVTRAGGVASGVKWYSGMSFLLALHRFLLGRAPTRVDDSSSGCSPSSSVPLVPAASVSSWDWHCSSSGSATSGIIILGGTLLPRPCFLGGILPGRAPHAPVIRYRLSLCPRLLSGFIGGHHPCPWLDGVGHTSWHMPEPDVVCRLCAEIAYPMPESFVATRRVYVGDS